MLNRDITRLKFQGMIFYGDQAVNDNHADLWLDRGCACGRGSASPTKSETEIRLGPAAYAKLGWHAFPDEVGISMLHKNWAHSFWIISKHAYAPIRSGQKHATLV